MLKLVTGKDRSCEFRDTFAYMDKALDEPIFFETITKGTLAEEPKGEMHEYNLGELHKLFIPERQDKTFCEMTVQEMDEWRQSKQENWCGKQFARWLKKA